MTPRERILVVNADDFGFSTGVNRAIVRAHEKGIVTSTSLMVRGPAVEDALTRAGQHPGLAIGLHLDLGEWICRDGEWHVLYEVVPLDDRDAIGEEVQRQFDTFLALLERKPTHVDSHQHVHLREPVLSVAKQIGMGLGVPVRHFAREVKYCGAFYGQTTEGSPNPDWISPAALIEVLAALSPGVTELACHPGEGDDFGTMYNLERAVETEVLCDPGVRLALARQEIQLRSFGELALDGSPAQTSPLKPVPDPADRDRLPGSHP